MMNILKNKIRICFISTIIFLFFTIIAENINAVGNSYYVSPSGTGTSCNNVNPCSLDTGLDKAQAGDCPIEMI